MITLHCRPPHTAPSEILIGDGLAASLRSRTAGRAVFAIVDDYVAAAHGALLDPTWNTLTVRAGEQLKTLAQAELVLRAMVATGLDRGGLLLAIGGGSVGDLGGLCAALFLRGIECWQVPTTLMGMVDSAVGGKTAVNLPEGKNLVGCVHQPALVVVDPTFVQELPPHEFQSGLAEAVKVAIGLDAPLFEVLERQAAAVQARTPAAIQQVVHRAVAAKIAVVEADLREDGPRRLLNLGHTLGHALEAHSGYTRPHGLCVARGLHFALDVARRLGVIDPGQLQRCRALLLLHEYPCHPLPDATQLEPFLRRDKKAARNVVNFVLPTGIGRSTVRALDIAELLGMLRG